MRLIRRIARNACAIVAVSLWLLWLIGQLLQDRFWLSGLCFYIPSPILAVVLAGFAADAWRRGHASRNLLCSLVVFPLIMIGAVENHWIRPAEHPGPASSVLRVVHWNVARSRPRWPEQLAWLQSLRPDVIVLSEASLKVSDDDFPSFHVRRFRDMVIAAPGSMQISPSLVRGGALHAALVTCELPEGPLRIMVADLTSNLAVPRDPYLRQFLKVIAEQRPDLILGDFNAPRRSRAFQSLPEGWTHAYDHAGSGWSSTWPSPLPFVAIDQCICGPDIRPVRYELQSTLLSDHRIQILDFTR